MSCFCLGCLQDFLFVFGFKRIDYMYLVVTAFCTCPNDICWLIFFIKFGMSLSVIFSLIFFFCHLEYAVEPLFTCVFSVQFLYSLTSELLPPIYHLCTRLYIVATLDFYILSQVVVVIILLFPYSCFWNFPRHNLWYLSPL